MQRDQVIVRTSVIGILANLFLATFKAVVGVVSGSIAIVLDAVNNLSDALSSVITIIGTKLAGRRPDREHPYGHGRIEYLSAIGISVLVLYAGITSLIASVRKLLSPTRPEYSAQGLVIVAVAVLVKVLLGRYVQGVGERVHSHALVDSGKDASLDAVISASTLAAALIFLTTGVSLEAWLAAVISLVIIKSGFEMLGESLSEILGQRADPALTRAIKHTVCQFPQVHGAYDLVLHNYGPRTMLGSVHIEVDDTLTAAELDALDRDIAQAVLRQHQVILTAIGIYARNTRDDAVTQLLGDVRRVVMAHEYVLQMHGFFADPEARIIRFDVIVDYAAPNAEAVRDDILRQLHETHPDYEIDVTLDKDVSD